MNCPNCGSSRVRRSKRNVAEKVFMPLLGLHQPLCQLDVANAVFPIVRGRSDQSCLSLGHSCSPLRRVSRAPVALAPSYCECDCCRCGRSQTALSQAVAGRARCAFHRDCKVARDGRSQDYGSISPSPVARRFTRDSRGHSRDEELVRPLQGRKRFCLTRLFFPEEFRFYQSPSP
jgi:hypothetical protein